MKALFRGYLLMGCGVCLWFGVAAYNGWRLPLPEASASGGSSSTVGRGVGGFWGGGK